ncbi:hypothetical protein X777_04871, partial [Ooceraea biroi]
WSAGTKLQNATTVRPREGCKVVITTCRYGRNEIPSSNETPAGCNVVPQPSRGEPQDQRGSRGLPRAVVPFYRVSQDHAKPATRKSEPRSDLDRSRRTPLAGSNGQNFHPELFRRGWRHRYFNPALSGNRARERAAATAITWSLNERLRMAENVDKGSARRISTIQYRNPPPHTGNPRSQRSPFIRTLGYTG